MTKEELLNNNRLFTIKETAEYFQVDPATLWRWEKKGVLKPFRIETVVRYEANEILSCVYNNKNEGKS